MQSIYPAAAGAILLNNPLGVQQNLYAQGFIQDCNYEMQAEELETHLLQILQRASPARQRELIKQTFDVPLNPEGEFAEELAQVFIANGNRWLVSESNQVQQAKSREIYFPWKELFLGLLAFLLLLLIIFISKRL